MEYGGLGVMNLKLHNLPMQMVVGSCDGILFLGLCNAALVPKLRLLDPSYVTVFYLEGQFFGSESLVLLVYRNPSSVLVSHPFGLLA